MQYVEYPAPPHLRHLVHCFWTLRGRGDGAAEPVVPDGRAELIVHRGEPFLEVGADGVARRQAAVLVSGQLTAPFRIASSSAADVIGVRFRTAAARAVLGVDMHELADRVVPLADARAPLALAVEGAAHRQGGLEAVIERFANGPATLAGALTSLDEPGGSVRAAARAVGVTPRTLERRFLAEVGLPPARMRSILRFRRTFRQLARTPAGAWARVAAECGYYDQAHMTRDFRRFAGVAPSVFFGADPVLAPAFLGAPPGDGVSHSS